MITDTTNLQILQLLADGLTAKEIGKKIFLSEASIVKRIQKMKEQTETRNRTELVVYYLREREEVKN